MKRNERPILNLPYTPLDLTLEAAAIGSLLLTIGLPILFWARLPASVPTHFGVSGAADAWGDKRSLLTLPSVGLLLYLTLTLVRRYPHTFNYPWPITIQNAPEQYRLARFLLTWLKAVTMLMFAYLEWVTIQAALEQTEGLSLLFLPLILGAIFGSIGIYFYYAHRAR